MKEITKKKQEVQGEKDDHEKHALLRIILFCYRLADFVPVVTS